MPTGITFVMPIGIIMPTCIVMPIGIVMPVGIVIPTDIVMPIGIVAPTGIVRPVFAPPKRVLRSRCTKSTFSSSAKEGTLGKQEKHLGVHAEAILEVHVPGPTVLRAEPEPGVSS